MQKDNRQTCFKNAFKRSVSALLTSAVLISSFSVFAVTMEDKSPGANARSVGVSGETNENVKSNESANQNVNGFVRENQYIDYYNKYKTFDKKLPNIVLDGASATEISGEDIKVGDYEGRKGTTIFKSEGSANYIFDVKEEGLYELEFDYMAIEDKGREIDLTVSLDGKIPYDDANRFTLTRFWDEQGEIITDEKDNELLPQIEEQFIWEQKAPVDGQGKYDSPYKFYLTPGTHKITIKLNNEKFAVDKMTLKNEGNLLSYDEYYKKYENKENKVTKDTPTIKIEAEDPISRNESALHPIYDRADPLTSPYHPTRIRYNTIGGSAWASPNKIIEWETTVEEAGFYTFSARFRQNFSRGMKVSRRLMVDDKVPFKEADNMTFKFDVDWQMKTLGKDITNEKNKATDLQEYKIYLTPGKHKISLETHLGEWTEIYREIEDLSYKLNYVYRNIIIVTGVKPDPNRDYYLEREIKDLMTWFKNLSKALEETRNKINVINGIVGGGEGENLMVLKRQIDGFIKDPSKITVSSGTLDTLKNNIRNVGNLMETYSTHPIELDCMYLAPSKDELPRAKANFFEKAGHEVKAFFATFYADYNLFSMEGEEGSLNVWVSFGREQAQIFKNLVDNDFTPKTGIKVNVAINPIPLENALMAKKAPDLMLNMGKGDPVRLALRDAFVPLDTFPGFKEVTDQYLDGIMVPYEYNGHYYALPETMSFPLIFYRKDIFDELGIKVPKTWDEFYNISSIIQNSNMEIGVGDLFNIFLYQKGGKYYKNNNMTTAFDEPEAVEAFQESNELFTMYNFPQVFDANNRFRTGEMPLIIGDFNTKPFLNVFAPEIRGLWDIAPIPGTLKEDGTIDFTVAGAASVVSTIVEYGQSQERKDKSWEFMKWWHSTDVQARYGQEVELLLGALARYSPANLEAFEKIPWSQADNEVIVKQRENIVEIPEVAGGYYVPRLVGYAQRKVRDKSANPRETLFEYNEDMNAEITRKRKQYNLPVIEDTKTKESTKEGGNK